MDSSILRKRVARRRVGAVGLACLGVAQLGCPRASPTASGLLAGVDLAAPQAAERPSSDPAVARCHREGRGAALGSDPSAGPTIVGDGVAFDGSYAMGLTHGSGQGPVAAVAWVSADVGVARIADIGPTLGDAPPPRLARRAGGLVAAYFLRGPGVEAKDVRHLALVAIDPLPLHGARQLAMSSQQADESLAFDVAFSLYTGLVVWDEVAARVPAAIRSPDAGGRGVIRGSAVDREWRVGAACDLSPPQSDAESPRVVSSPSGFLVFWIAIAPDSERLAPADADSHAGIGSLSEVTGEVRTNGWVEMLALDSRAVPIGPVRRLTSERGHVSSYDVLRLESDRDSTVVVVARDDGDLTDGTGGTLLIVRASDGGPEPPITISSGGLGRGAPALVGATPPWVAWVGDREELRMLPLTLAGRPEGVPSQEEALGEARPLLGIASSTGDARPADRFLAVIPAERDESIPTVAVAVCDAP